MGRRTLADVTGIKGTSNSVLAAPWPYLLTGLILLAVAAWSIVGGTSSASQSQGARQQAQQAVSQIGRVVEEVQSMLRSESFQALAQKVEAGEAISSSLLAEARRVIPEVTDVHFYGPDVFMTDIAAMGQNGFIMLDMMSEALEEEVSPVQFIQSEGLSYVSAATTIGRAVQNKGFVLVYLDPSYLLNLFNIPDPAAGYIALEHAAGANAPLSLKAVGSTMPAGYRSERLEIPNSLLQVVYPQRRDAALIGPEEQIILVALGGLLALFGIARHLQLRRKPQESDDMPNEFVTLPDVETLRATTPPTLAGARAEKTLKPAASAASNPDGARPRSTVTASDSPAARQQPAPPLSRPPADDSPLQRADEVPEDPPLVPRIAEPTGTPGPASGLSSPPAPGPEKAAEPPREPSSVPKISQPAEAAGDELPPFIPSSSLTPPEEAAASEPDVAEPDVAEPVAAKPDAPEPAAPEQDTPPTIPPRQGDSVELSSEIFRAYDIRGIVGKTLDRGIAFMIGQAVGSVAVDSLAGPLVVGRDGRHSGPDLVDGLVEGIATTGCDVIDVGAVPTGALYFAAYERGKGSGVMVTGSHNPPDYNGFKIMIGGKTLSGDDIFGLFERLRTGNLRQGDGQVSGDDVLDAYRARIASDIQLARPLKVVADAGNGIGGVCATAILRDIGAEVIPLYDDVDGDFPNHHPDPSDPENLRDLIESVHLTGADLGVAFDGDADRLGVVTPEGEIVFSDRIMMLYAREVLSRNPGETIIYDVKCTGHLDTVIKEAGGVPEMYKTGHSLIKNRMKEVNAPFAGEMSGHFFFKDRWYGFDCGIYSACRLLEILAARTESPSEVLAALPNSVSTPELKVQLEEGENHAFIEQFQKQANFPDARLTTIDGVRADWPDGWGLVRASNTTPILVLRFDADSKEALNRVQEAFRSQLLALKPDMTLPF